MNKHRTFLPWTLILASVLAFSFSARLPDLNIEYVPGPGDKENSSECGNVENGNENGDEEDDPIPMGVGAIAHEQLKQKLKGKGKANQQNDLHENHSDQNENNENFYVANSGPALAHAWSDGPTDQHSNIIAWNSIPDLNAEYMPRPGPNDISPSNYEYENFRHGNDNDEDDPMDDRVIALMKPKNTEKADQEKNRHGEPSSENWQLFQGPMKWGQKGHRGGRCIKLVDSLGSVNLYLFMNILDIII